VLASESAFITDNYSIARQIVEDFLLKISQKDQFYCRSKIVLGLLIDIESQITYGEECILNKKRALQELMTALSISSSPENKSIYNFLTFNVSMECWRIVKPFLRPIRASQFVDEMKRVSDALYDISDFVNKDWLITFISGAAYCLQDANQGKEASELLDKGAIIFAEEAVANANVMVNNVKEQLSAVNVEIEQIHRQLFAIESQIENEVKSKLNIDDNEEKKDNTVQTSADNNTVSEQLIALRTEHSNLSSTMTNRQNAAGQLKDKYKEAQEFIAPLIDRVMRLYMQRIYLQPADAKRVATLPAVIQNFRMKILAQLHCIQAGCVPVNDRLTSCTALLKDVLAAPPSADVAETLFDMSRICRVQSQGNELTADNKTKMNTLALECFEKGKEMVRANNFLSPVLLVKQDLCSALEIVDSSVSQDTSSQNLSGMILNTAQMEGKGVSSRLEALKLFERVLSVCQGRMQDYALVQEICVEMWNAVYPLIQTHLRKLIHRTLQQMATALASIESPLLKLRAEIHLELAKCEEMSDFVSKAFNEIAKARVLDYGELSTTIAPAKDAKGSKAPPPAKGGIAPSETMPLPPVAIISHQRDQPVYDKTRCLDSHIELLYNTLQLRSSVYNTPDAIEDQVFLTLLQIRDSSSRRYKKEMLLKSSQSMWDVLQDETNNSTFAEVNSLPTSEDIKLETIEGIVKSINVNAMVPSPEASTAYSLSKNIQKRVKVVSSISNIGYQLQAAEREILQKSAGNVDELKSLAQIVQKSLLYILTQQFSINDFMSRDLVVMQVESLCVLAESIVSKLDSVTIYEDEFMKNDAVIADVSELDTLIDPRALGINIELPVVDDETPEDVESRTSRQQIIISTKRCVLICLTKALEISIKINDIIAVQNVITYFWNMHIHIVRRNLYHLAIPEVFEFLKYAASGFEILDIYINSLPKSRVSTPQVNDKLRYSIVECLALCASAQNNAQIAIDTAAKGCSNITPHSSIEAVYERRRLSELWTRLLLTPSSTKVGKGVGDVSLPTLQHPLLTVASLLAAMETISARLTPETEESSKATLNGMVSKCTQLMNNEVKAVVAAYVKNTLSLEDADMLQEMLVENWTRLTRANLKLNNTHAIHENASSCMSIVHNGILQSAAPSQEGEHTSTTLKLKINKKVWRWASLCERLMGISISRLIKSDGQDKELQIQLRLASSRHFVLSCQFARNGEKDDIVLSSAIDAWNVMLQLIEDLGHSKIIPGSPIASLISLQKSIIESLVACKTPEPLDDNESGEHQDHPIDIVKQQFYLAVIEEYANAGDWNSAMSIVNKSFENTPSSLQKPLWKWRVIVMSKKGKSVLDGLQKLKEGDPALQARVYAILARSASKPRHQLDAYVKCIDILKADIQRVEYLLEVSQWMSSIGLPKHTLAEILRAAIDALYEVEEIQFTDNGDDDKKDDVSVSSRSKSIASAKSNRTGTANSMRSRKASVAGSVRRSSVKGSAKSVATTKSTKTERFVDNNRLNIKQLDQACRTIAMLSLLESEGSARVNRCLEFVFFVQRSLDLWQTVLLREASTLAISEGLIHADSPPPHNTKHHINATIPKSALDLLTWIPSSEFLSFMTSVNVLNPLYIPSDSSLGSTIQLSVFYLLRVVETLESAGYTSSALLCLAWCRICLSFVTKLENIEVLQVTVHFKTLNLLARSGVLTVEGDVDFKLPTTIGFTKVTIESFVSSILEKVSSNVMDNVSAPSDNAITFNQTDAMSETQFSSKPSDRTVSTYRTEIVEEITGSSLTWTKEMQSEIDIYSCYIELAESFRTVGLHVLSKRIASYSALKCKFNEDTRGYVIASTLMAEIDLMGGRYKEVIYYTNQLKSLMESIGDNSLLSRHTVLLMQSYMKVSDEIEADNVASTVLNVLEQVANFRLADSNNTTNINIPNSIDGELSVSNTSRERSFDAVNGFIRVAFAYIDYVLVPQKSMSLKNSSAKKLVVSKNGISTNGFDMSDVLTVFDRCDALVLSTHGQLCFLRAQIFRKRALTIWQLFLDIHRNYSRYFNSSVESYEQFTARVVNQCIDDLDYAKTILLDIESRVPIFESTVVKDIPVAASVPSTKASEIAPGKGGKKPAAVEAAAPLEPTESVIPSRVALTSLLRRLLVSIELNLTMVHATLSIKSAGTLTEEYLKTVSSKSDNSSNLQVLTRHSFQHWQLIE
jgi:hypothetical protein